MADISARPDASSQEPSSAMIFGLVMSVIAAVKANGGEYYRYPLTIRFVK